MTPHLTTLFVSTVGKFMGIRALIELNMEGTTLNAIFINEGLKSAFLGDLPATYSNQGTYMGIDIYFYSSADEVGHYIERFTKLNGHWPKILKVT